MVEVQLARVDLGQVSEEVGAELMIARQQGLEPGEEEVGGRSRRS